MKKTPLVICALCYLSTASFAANNVVVIPLYSEKPTTCTAPDEVLSQGQCWMDRNLGAYRVATSLDDPLAIGEFYQWGRWKDGHQFSTGSTTDTQSTGDDPGNSDFITDSTDWRTTHNDNLWQGAEGINNPCPQGFRLPTATEFEIEVQSWASKDRDGAFASPLKLVLGGRRLYDTGLLFVASSTGYNWTSTVAGDNAKALNYGGGSEDVYIDDQHRADGMQVRCIKN